MSCYLNPFGTDWMQEWDKEEPMAAALGLVGDKYKEKVDKDPEFTTIEFKGWCNFYGFRFEDGTEWGAYVGYIYINERRLLP